MAMTLRLNDQQTEALRRTAEREHRSMQAVAVDAIEEYTSARDAEREALLARIVEEDEQLLYRLGMA